MIVMAKGHDHDHDHHGHDHDHGEEVLEFSAKKPSKLKTVDADASYSVEGTDGGSFAVASSKKELKQLMKSDADVVYDEKKGKLYLNANGEEKGWGKKKVGGLIARFKGKPELSAEQFEGMGFDCYLQGAHGSLWRLTGGCFDEAYEVKRWANVVCVRRDQIAWRDTLLKWAV